MVPHLVTWVHIDLGDGASHTGLAHHLPTKLTKNMKCKSTNNLPTCNGDCHETDPEGPIEKVKELNIKSTSPSNLYNLAGCARIKVEPECAADTRVVNDAATPVDETYYDSTTFGYAPILTVLTLELVVDTRTMVIVVSKLPNTVGSCNLNATTLNLESYMVPKTDTETIGTGGGINATGPKVIETVHMVVEDRPEVPKVPTRYNYEMSKKPPVKESLEAIAPDSEGIHS